MIPDNLGRIIAIALFVGALAAATWLDRSEGEFPGAAELGFRFREVSDEVEIDFTHHSPRLDDRIANIGDYVASMGASVSVADVNDDGLPDLYFTNSAFDRPNALYMNEGDGTFRNVASAAGVADLNREEVGVSMGSVWADYDNDGDEDLLVYRWGYLALLENQHAETGDVRFRDVTRKSGLRRWMNANNAVWLDYDRDGLVDLFVAGYYRSRLDLWDLETTSIMPNSFEYASNGGRNRLFHNEGNGQFTDVTDSTNLGSRRWTLAAASADFNDDGWPDLYLANDYGPERLYLNEDGEHFQLADVGLGESGSGMSVALGDLYNRGRLDVYVTNISEPGYLFQGNNLRTNFLSELGRFKETAKGPVADAGWAWGAQFGDLNSDGRTDLFVTNGFVSANREKDYWYGMSKIAGAAGPLIENADNWPPIEDASLSGYERSRVLVNRPGEGLVPTAPSVGVDDQLDGRAVALADLFNEGELDAIVANQEGPALVYRNSVAPDRHWISFRLEGAARGDTAQAGRSNRSAIGARVTLHFDGTERASVVTGGSGFASQNDRRLYFGLGSTRTVDRAVVEWPSGRRQVLHDLSADRLHVVRETNAGAPSEEAQPVASTTENGNG